MTLSQVRSVLESIDKFKDKVAYRSFKVGNAPKLPFICYLDTATSNFVADNQVYTIIQEVDVELYTRYKDVESEALIEAKFAENNIVWDKYEEFLEDENCYEVVYTFSINQ